MTLAVLFGGPVHFTGGALALFPATTATTLRLRRGRGSHRYQRTQQALWRHLSTEDLSRASIPLRGQFLRRRVRRGQAGRVLDGKPWSVTEWVPARKLAFVALTDAPAMRELRPNAHVHASL